MFLYCKYQWVLAPRNLEMIKMSTLARNNGINFAFPIYVSRLSGFSSGFT